MVKAKSPLCRWREERQRVFFPSCFEGGEGLLYFPLRYPSLPLFPSNRSLRFDRVRVSTGGSQKRSCYQT